MTQTFIPGKDAALEDSIARFQQKLLDLGFHIEEASWLNPVPNVWSVHIRDKECALCFTNGKGATKKAALASALGEYFERLSTNYFFADFWLGETIANSPFVHYPNEKWFPLTENDDVPEGLLDARLRAFYDPENELTGSQLIDLQSGIATLEAEGFPIFAYDGSLGGKYPVICVVLFNPANGTCFASFGAHPDFGVALERTVTELLQGRGLKDLDVFTPPTFDDEEVAEHTNLETHFIDSSGLISWDLFKQDADYPFTDWSFSGTTEEEFATLMAIFAAEDKEVYIADYEHLGVYACRIIVPGMSDIYPAEDLWLANNNMGSHLREILLSLPGSAWNKEDYLNLIEQLDEEGFDDFTRVRELLGLATGADNGWYTLRVGELKAMLALAGGDLEQALIWTEWTMEFNSSVFSPVRANYYRCLQTLLLLSQEDARQPLQYLNAFIKMYGAEAVEAASAALSGEAAFYGLPAVDHDLQAFPAHQSLLKAYDKLQRAKAAYWSK
ncbi:YcaO-like family protein [Salmonella enterica subsp. enterica serovar Infantis]|nr:YcaO-like family protein [Salmonella enterica]EMA9274779.1 YcaO-like family protein [Salmonella enterica subsp. enterica serovar Infantis]